MYDDASNQEAGNKDDLHSAHAAVRRKRKTGKQEFWNYCGFNRLRKRAIGGKTKAIMDARRKENDRKYEKLETEPLHLGKRVYIMGILNVTPDSFFGRWKV